MYDSGIRDVQIDARSNRLSYVLDSFAAVLIS